VSSDAKQQTPLQRLIVDDTTNGAPMATRMDAINGAAPRRAAQESASVERTKNAQSKVFGDDNNNGRRRMAVTVWPVDCCLYNQERQ
jgi:hypothetical protein